MLIFIQKASDLEDEKYSNKDNVESQSRLKAVIETAVDGIITIDSRGIMETVNPAAASIFGYEPSEMVGHNVNMLMPEPDSGMHDGYIRRYMQTGEGQIIGKGR
ncbi:MAG: PAS domain S-box protein, partial [Pontibacter sp.]|nr:PAS domain S-box protein [Pontibacter sp.]